MSLLSRLFRRSPKEEASRPVSPRAASVASKPSVAQSGTMDAQPYSPALLSQAAGGQDARAAQRRIAALIEAGEVSFDTMAAQGAAPEVMLAIAVHLEDRRPLGRLLAAATPEQWLDWAMNAPSTQVRQHAAEKIEDPVALRRLLKEARGKDKNVYRIAKSKADALAAVERQSAAQQARIVALCESIERQVHKPYDNLFVPAVEHLANQWQEVDAAAPADVRARAQRALERCHEIISEHVRDLAAKAAAANAIENARQQRELILAEWPKFIGQIYAADSFDDADREQAERGLRQFRERWQDTLVYVQPSRGETQRFEQLEQQSQALIHTVDQHGTLKSQVAQLRNADENSSDVEPLKRMLEFNNVELSAEMQALMDEARAVVAKVQDVRQQHVSQAGEQERQVEALIRKASAALRQGRSASATGLRRAIDEKLQAGISLAPRSANQLQQLDAKLKELQDWKHYAVAPKRLELIEQMEALVGAQQDPDELAEQIKELQSQWRTLSRGAPDESDAEWMRFKAAADKAYEPCKAHFKAQSELRAANLERRKEVLAELEEFAAAHDWEQPNWNEVLNRSRSAREAWRSAHPTDRAATKPVQAQFDAVMQLLHSRLDAEFERNVQRKRRLIAQAQALTSADDSRHAIDEIKRLQAEWKNVGMVPRAQDQPLWLEFRTHCDAVFQRSKANRAEFVAALESNKVRAIAICEELEALASAGAEQGRVQALEAEFESIESLPRAEAQQIRTRFQRAVAAIEQGKRRHKRERELQGWYQLLQATTLANQAQCAQLGQRAEDAAALRASAEQQLGQLEGLPRATRDAVRAKLESLDHGDVTQNQRVLRALCIRAELLTDTPTPEHDAQLRREHQLRSLVQDFGRARASMEEQLETLLLEWIAVGPVTPAIHDELTARLASCVRKVIHGAS